MLTTDRQIQAQKPKGKVYWTAVQSPHGGGLTLRVTPGGVKAWYFRFRWMGKADAMLLGRYPTMGLAEARKAHAAARENLDAGINPKRAAKERRDHNAAAWTMQELFDAWHPVYARTPTVRTRRPPGSKTVAEHAWRWSHYLAPKLGNYSVTTVTRKDLTVAAAGVAEQARSEARKCLTMLKQMFDYAIAKGQLEENPAETIKPEKIGATLSMPRSRVLTVIELRKLWQAIESSKSTTAVRAALKILILTGQRRTETCAARWSDIDLDAGTWLIPADNNKSHREHVVYLPSLAIEVLGNMERRHDFVFPGREPGQPIGADALNRALTKIRSQMKAVAPFTLHDLRRTVATGMAEHCGVQPHIIERVLNHAPEVALVGVYQRADYRSEKAAAWKAWGDLIETRVAKAPGNVVSLRKEA